VRILLDEGVPVQIRKALGTHSATTVQEAGWGSFTNGELLAIAEGTFDLFITADQNLKYQQNLTGRKIAILELSSNRRRTIEENFDLIVKTINDIGEGAFISLALSK
jgi:predicted nuclease of predicted toxin-antitoxin system